MQLNREYNMAFSISHPYQLEALLEGLYWLRVDMVCDIEKNISYTLYYIHIHQVDVFYVTRRHTDYRFDMTSYRLGI